MTGFELIIVLVLFEALNLAVLYGVIRGLYFLFRPPTRAREPVKEGKLSMIEQMEELLNYDPLKGDKE